MRSLPVLLSFLVALTIGLLVGMELSSGGETSEGSSAPPRSEGRVTSDRGSGADRGVRSRFAEASFERGESPASEGSARVDDREVQAAIRRIDSPTVETPTGDGVIRGRVILEEQSGPSSVGLSDVTIIARRQDSRSGWTNAGFGQAAPPELSLDDAMRKAADGWARNRSNTLRVVTDSEGRFEFRGLTDSNYSFTAHREGYRFASESNSGNNWASHRPGATVSFLANQVFLQRFDIRLPDGSQPERAYLNTEDADPWRRTRGFSWSPSQPQIGFQNLDDEWVVQAVELVQDGRYGSSFRYQSETFTLSAQSAADPARVIQLEACAGLAGTIRVVGERAGNNEVLADARVAITRLENPSEFDPDALNFEGQPWGPRASKTTAFVANGQFGFSPLEPGNYGIGLRIGGVVVDSAVVAIVDEIEELEFLFEPTAASGALRVTVLGPDGAPLNGCRFSKTNWIGGSGRGGGVRAKRAGPGIYEIPHHQLANYDFSNWPAEHRVDLDVSHPDFPDQEIDLVEGQTELTIQFETPCTLTVSVLGFGQSPYSSKVQLSLRFKNENDSWESRGAWHRAELGLDGVAEYGGLPAGTYRAELEIRQQRYSSITIARREFQVGEGVNQASIQIPSLSSLIVRTSGVEEGTNATLRGQAGQGDSEMTIYVRSPVQADGTIEFEPIPFGSYSVSIRGRSGSMPVEVPADVDVVFRAEGPDCMRVAIADESGALHRIGLRSGDVIVRVNEIRLSVDTYGDARSALRAGGATILVMRDGQTLQFDLGDLNPYADPDTTGGTLIAGNR